MRKKKNKSHWFDYLSTIVLLIFTIAMMLTLFDINICLYVLPVFMLYVVIASCEHARMRDKTNEKTLKNDIISEIFTENCQ